MKWAGHMIRMTDDRLPKRSETKKQEGCRKRERPQLRCEDGLKRDLGKAREEEKWRENSNNREHWKQVTAVAIQQTDERFVFRQLNMPVLRGAVPDILGMLTSL